MGCPGRGILPSGMDPVADARALLPAYVAFGPLVVACASGALLGALCTWIAARIAGGPALALDAEEARELPWTERARRVYPLRITLAAATILVPTLVGLLAWLTVGPLSRVSSGVVGLCSALATLVTVLIVRRATTHRLAEPLRWPSGTPRMALARLLILYPHLLVLLVTFVILPPRFNLRAWITLGIAGGLTLAVMWGRQLVVARWLGLVVPAGEKLAAAVRLAEERVGVRARRTVEIPLAAANALAFPLSRVLAFTRTAVDRLEVEELAAVAAHELGHVAEKWHVSLFRLSAPLLMLPLAAGRPLVGTIGVWGLVGAEILLVVSLILLRRLARRMEERADHLAHTHQIEPGRYATALEHLYRLNLVPAVLASRRRVHPHLYDRLTAAGVVPDYPRPLPPSRSRSRGASAVIVCLPLLLMSAPHLVASTLRSSSSRDEGALARAAALDGGNAWTLGALGFLRSGRPDAVTLFRACAALDRSDSYCESCLCNELARSGHCDAAQRAAAESLKRARRYETPADEQALRERTRQSLDYCRWVYRHR